MAKKKGGGKGKKDPGFGARYNGALEHVTGGASPDDATADERKQAAAIAHGGKSIFAEARKQLENMTLQVR